MEQKIEFKVKQDKKKYKKNKVKEDWVVRKATGCRKVNGANYMDEERRQNYVFNK